MKYFPILIFISFIFLSCQNKRLSHSIYQTAIQSAEHYFYNHQNDSAFYFYNKAYLATSNKDADRKLYTAAMMALLQNQIGDYVGAEQSLTAAIDFKNKVQNKLHLIQVYNEYGKTYRNQKNYQASIDYFNKSIALNENPVYAAVLTNNIAVTHLDNGQYHEAINLLTPLLATPDLEKDTVNYAKVLDNIGLAYFRIGFQDLAFQHLDAALRLRASMHDEFQKTTSYIHFSWFYEEVDKALALVFSEKAYASARESNNPDDLLQSLKLLVKNHSHQQSLYYFKQFEKLSDSLETVRALDKNQFAKIKWDYTQAIRETAIQKNQKTMYLLLLMLAVLSGVLGYFYLKKRNKLKLHLSVYDTETRLSKKLHDELANDVFQALTFVEHKTLGLKEHQHKLLEYLERIYSRTRNISREHASIDLSENFFNDLKLLIRNYESAVTNIIINTNNLQRLNINEPAKIVLYRVVQELLTNMKKHSEASVVFISFQDLSNAYEIKYSDNGKGCKTGVKVKNGLTNVENRIFSIQGTISFETSTPQGFKATIVIPKET